MTRGSPELLETYSEAEGSSATGEYSSQSGPRMQAPTLARSKSHFLYNLTTSMDTSLLHQSCIGWLLQADTPIHSEALLSFWGRNQPAYSKQTSS